jgi:glycosyltransferase involved in cell wall biosynthesis
MRVAIDAMCAEFGGIRTYVQELVGDWARLFPDDEVHVFLRAGSTITTPGLRRHELRVPRPDVVGRPWVQSAAMMAAIRGIDPDVVLATAPTTAVWSFPSPLVVTIHDLRSELRPEQFSRGRRLLRAVSYGRTYELADAFVAVSRRSLDDLHRLHPRTRPKPAAVVHSGADHVSAWPAPARTGPAIAFAHHANKNPALVVDAWGRLVHSGAEVPDLLLLGVSASLRGDLDARIDQRGVRGRVELAPFLPDDEFRRRTTQAAAVVFPSDFEGFGMPVVEGMALGKPVVISPDPGMLEVAGGHAVVMAGWTADDLADAVVRALARSERDLEAARDWASSFTWERTIRQTRAALALAGSGQTGT